MEDKQGDEKNDLNFDNILEGKTKEDIDYIIKSLKGRLSVKPEEI